MVFKVCGFVSENHTVYDTYEYDIGTQNNHSSNTVNSNSNAITVTRDDSGTLITYNSTNATSTSDTFTTPSQTNRYVDYAVEFDVLSISGYVRIQGVIIDSENITQYPYYTFPSDVSHVKIEVKSTGITYIFDDRTPITPSLSYALSRGRLRFNFIKNRGDGSIKFANLKVYQI